MGDRHRNKMGLDPQWLEELSAFLSIRSVSADPAHAADVELAAAWVRDFVRSAGGEAVIERRGRHPLVIGEFDASHHPSSCPTVLLYGHFDVQSADPVDQWASPPYEATIRDGWLCARGISDDKGQLYMLLKAVELLARANSLPVNVRVVCDGEEEILGRSIADYLAGDNGPADACVIFDAFMPKPGTPAFFLGVRGLAYFNVRLSTGHHDLHSGVYGGATLSATSALIEMLGKLLPRHGAVPDELRIGTIPPSDEEVASWQTLEPGADVIAAQEALPLDARAATNFYIRTWAEPAVDVHGLSAGSPHVQKTILPMVADASLSVRLAPGQDVEVIAPEFERLLRQAAPDGTDLQIELLSSSQPALIPPDSQAIQLGLQAFERALGVRPLLLRIGGSLPVISALSDRSIPTILTGFDLPQGNVHGPNERLRLEHLPLGVSAAQELLISLAHLEPSKAESNA